MTAPSSIRRILSGMTLSAAAIAIAVGVPVLPTLAQTNPGLTLFGGVDSEYRLSYTLQYNEPRSPRARYYLRVPGDKLERAVSHFRISYPLNFTERNGAFDVDSIEVRRGRGRGGDTIPLDDVVWTPESGQLDLYFQDVVPAETSVVIVMSDVRNPNRFGIHNFNLEAEYRGDVLPRYIGTWEMLVAEE